MWSIGQLSILPHHISSSFFCVALKCFHNNHYDDWTAPCHNGIVYTLHSFSFCAWPLVRCRPVEMSAQISNLLHMSNVARISVKVQRTSHNVCNAYGSGYWLLKFYVSKCRFDSINKWSTFSDMHGKESGGRRRKKWMGREVRVNGMARVFFCPSSNDDVWSHNESVLKTSKRMNERHIIMCHLY